MFLSILRHHTWILDNAFMCTMPGWPVCNLSRTHSRNGRGIIMHVPHKRQFSLTVISWRLLKYRLIDSSTCSVDHPVKVYSNTIDKIGSACVALRTCSTETGKDSSCTRLISWISSFSFRTWSFNGNLDKQLAFTCLSVDHYSISYW